MTDLRLKSDPDFQKDKQGKGRETGVPRILPVTH